MKESIRCTYMRGGTSKACFFLKEDLPRDESERDRILMRIMGSPDPKQIDGMGGAAVTTSKVAIISKSEREDADIDYDFNQVGIDSARVDKNANCGNISSAVGPFAIDKGLVKITEPETLVRIYNLNTDKIIHAHVPVKNGKYDSTGGYKIAGVPGTGGRIALDFFSPEGAATGKTLPTGSSKDIISVNGKDYEVSFVDAANPVVFMKSEQFGIDPCIMPVDFDKLQGITEIRKTMEQIRAECAVRGGIADSVQDFKKNAPVLPKLAVCSPACGYISLEGDKVNTDNIDCVGRFLSHNEKIGAAFAVTGAICMGVAACIPGTIVNEITFGENIREVNILRLGHPSGVMDIQIRTGNEGIVSCQVGRTARKIMEGLVFI